MPDQPKSKGGRPKLKIDPDSVTKLAAIHCTHAEIAAVLGCSTDTLVRRFADCIEKGRDQGKMSLRRIQFQLAQNGNATMAIWLGKQWLAQKDVQEHTGPGGGPIKTETTHKIVIDRERCAEEFDRFARQSLGGAVRAPDDN